MSLSQIYIHQQVVDESSVHTIRFRLPHVPVQTVQNSQAVFDALHRQASDKIQAGKEILYLNRNKGAFLKDCPGTRAYTCCGYKILHIGSFCTMDCSYCILQTYFHPPVLQYFVNHDRLDMELDRLFSEPGIHRVGTGEFTDSLIWEPWTDLSRYLVPRFAAQRRAILELKTKTTAISNLSTLSHEQKTIMAWSLNTKAVISHEERQTASLGARIRAAATCQSWGYPLAFHFDPMVIYPGCEADYENVIDSLFSRIDPDRIVWISLGTFRFIPPLKPIITRRFPDSKIIYGELIPGLDGKMRYFKPLRIALYEKMVRWIREKAPNVMVYLCMEDDEVWQKSFGFIPSEKGGLSHMLDDSAREICGLEPTT
ncbi:MAG: DNA photolyase [Deltaproteobacteria bacterium]|nr:DNA photolyase [Deltaproteobacteria bacterium]